MPANGRGGSGIERRNLVKAVGAGAFGVVTTGTGSARTTGRRGVVVGDVGSCGRLEVPGGRRGWPLARSDVANTGRAPAGAAPDGGGLSLDWSFATGNEGTNVPVVARDTVFAATDYPNGDLFAVDPDDGTAVWTSRTDGIQEVTPAVGPGVVTGRAGVDDTVLAHDPESGRRRTFQFQPGYVFDLLATPSTVVVAHDPPDAGRPEVAAVDGRSGAACWRSRFLDANATVADVAASDGTLFVAAVEGGHGYPNDGHVFSVSPERGATNWAVTTDYPVRGLAVGPDLVYVVTAAAAYGVDRSAGTVTWRTDRGGGPTVPAVTTDAVYVGGRFELVALDATTGNVQWTTPVEGHGIRPSVGGDTVYAAADALPGRPGTLVAVDRATGEVTGRTTFGQVDVTAPAVAGGGVYVGTDDGTVHRYS